MRLERMRSRVSSSGAWRRTSSSKVALASSIIAHSSPPLVSTPAAANSAGSTRRSSLPSSGRPSESASRLAGSIVSTATFLPARRHPGGDRRRGGRLADPARAGADADPLALEQLARRRPSALPSELAGELADLLDAELGLEDERQGPTAAPRRAPRAGRAARAGRRAAALAQRRAARAASAAVGLARSGLEPLDLGLARSAPGRARSCRPGRPRRRRPRSASRSSAAVSLTGISSGRATIATPVLRG